MNNDTTQPREQASPDTLWRIKFPDGAVAVIDSKPADYMQPYATAYRIAPVAAPEAQKAVAIVTGSSVQWLEGAGKLPDRAPLYATPVAAPEAPKGSWTIERYGMRGELCRVYDGAKKQISEGYTTELRKLVDAHNASTGAAPLVPEVAASEQQAIPAAYSKVLAMPEGPEVVGPVSKACRVCGSFAGTLHALNCTHGTSTVVERDCRATPAATAASASIDNDPEFQRLVEYWRGEPYGTRSFQNAWDELVRYIDSRAALTQQSAAQAPLPDSERPLYSTLGTGDSAHACGTSFFMKGAAPIAAQLDQDERAKFEAYVRKELKIPDHVHVTGRSESVLNAWDVWQAARRAEPVAAQLDAELPPLESLMTYDPERDAPGLMEYRDKYNDGDYCKVEDVRNFVAPYAERIRLLERELERLCGDDKPAAWAVGLEVFMSQSEVQRNVRNPDLKPEPLYRRAQLPQSTPSALELVNAGALRQFRHNDGSEGFVFAYDKAITNRVFSVLGRTAGTAPEAAPDEVQPAPPTKETEEPDPLYNKAVMIVRAHNRASVALVQRILVIGYNRASRLLAAMEVAGMVSAMDQNGCRTMIAAAPSPQENTN